MLNADWRSIKRLLPFLALSLLWATVAGCQPDKCQTTPALPADNADHVPVDAPGTTRRWQGEMAGEVSQNAVILQARLTEDGKVRSGDVKGCPGIGAFVLSNDQGFAHAFRTRWQVASAENDYLIKTRVSELEPGTRYYYRLLSGPNEGSVEAGPTGTFRTLDPPGVSREVRFAVVTGMNRFAFLAATLKDLAFKDRELGFPGLATILVWVFAASFVTWLIIKAIMGIRVSEEEEFEGVDLSECGMEAYPEFTGTKGSGI
jgi:hypothetical protein